MILLPCPICGKEVVMGKTTTEEGKVLFRVTCGGCGMHTLSFKKDEVAAAAWNDLGWRLWLGENVVLNERGKFQVVG